MIFFQNRCKFSQSKWRKFYSLNSHFFLKLFLLKSILKTRLKFVQSFFPFFIGLSFSFLSAFYNKPEKVELCRSRSGRTYTEIETEPMYLLYIKVLFVFCASRGLVSSWRLRNGMVGENISSVAQKVSRIQLQAVFVKGLHWPSVREDKVSFSHGLSKFICPRHTC